jgi:hypothetical protein
MEETSEEIQPQVPTDYNTLKDATRRGLGNSAVRAYWWPVMCNLASCTSIDTYPDISAAKDGVVANEPSLSQTLQITADGKGTREIVTSACQNLTDVILRAGLLASTESDLFSTLLRLVAFQLRKLDVSYLVACDLLSNREK